MLTSWAAHCNECRRSEGEYLWGRKMHHSWHRVHFPFRGGWGGPGRGFWRTWPEPLTAEKTSFKCTEPRSANMLGMCKTELQLCAVRLCEYCCIDSYPWRSRCCIWGWKSSFQVGEFHIYCNENREERRGVVSAGWGKVQVQSSPNQVHDPVLVFDPWVFF